MEHASKQWTTLAVMAAVSFAAMYALMYLMVDTIGNVYPNVNQFYMAAVMTAAMMLIEIVLMRSMYSRGVRRATVAVSIIALVVFTGLLRTQAGVSDREFLKSMIPHHGAALLMCKQAELRDTQIRSLCEGIISGQQAEIDWMRRKLMVD